MAISIIAGSTGLIGRNVLEILCNKQESVIALTRRPISDLPTNANQLVIDFDSLSSFNQFLRDNVPSIFNEYSI